jgi:predicted RNA-binding protein YlqC (UPF0109 family)
MENPIDVQFLNYIVSAVVNYPNDVKIERKVDERGVLLTLSVNQEDLGRVIGKRGSTAEALRSVLRVLGMKHGAHYNLKIVDPTKPNDFDSNYQSTPRSVNVDNSPDQNVEETPTSSEFVENTKKELEELDS